MTLLSLSITNVRNIKQAEFNPSEKFNLIVGVNASGKTSLLEAIYILGFAKSFRTTNPKKMISRGEDEMTVFGQIAGQTENNAAVPIAVCRNKKAFRIKLNNRMLQSRSELTLNLPLQLINPESHRILELGPKFRRQYMDWGVFHVEHGFLQAWKDFYHILKQRNAALRHNSVNSMVNAWNEGLIVKAEIIHQLRTDYFLRLTPCFERLGLDVFSLPDLSIEYLTGWPKDLTYREALESSLERDKLSGFTNTGPHRADISIKISNRAVLEFASRGQQKMIITVLKLSQVWLLKEESNKRCPILIDDLASELDTTNRAKLINALKDLDTQIFITTTEKSLVDITGIHDKKMFHVEHGTIFEIS